MKPYKWGFISFVERKNINLPLNKVIYRVYKIDVSKCGMM